MISNNKINEFNEKSMRRIAKQIIVLRYLLVVHMYVYLFTNIVLFVINYYTGFDSKWFFYPLVGWGALFLVHCLAYSEYKLGIIKISNIILYYDVGLYVIGNILCFLLDALSSPIRWQPSGWYLYVLCIWSFILILNLAIHYIILPKEGEDKKKNWLERKIEIEMISIKNEREYSKKYKKSERKDKEGGSL